jgi:hypothetical protein
VGAPNKQEEIGIRKFSPSPVQFLPKG